MIALGSRYVGDAHRLYRHRSAYTRVVLGTVAALALGVQALEAQQWRGRLYSRVQYVEARALRLDSIAIEEVGGVGRRREIGDTIVTCAPGASHCFFRQPDDIESTAPLIQDLDLSAWGFGVQGLRLYFSGRIRTAIGGDEFWPRTDDNFDLLAGYAELRRDRFRIRIGRDYQISGLGFYGYDGGSAVVRFEPAEIELEAYGGWGLARGLPEPVNSDALASLEEFQPQDRNLLFGFRASARPVVGASFEAIYQREIETDRSGIATERIGLEGSYAPSDRIWFRGHADYDLATDWWGKAGATVGFSPAGPLYVEGRLFRYRPVFSLQTIWAAFTPTPYTGWGITVGYQPYRDLSIRVEGERRAYGETEAEVPFFVVTDRTWRAGTSAQWQVGERWSLQAGYWLNWGFGAGLSAGELRAEIRPRDRLTLGARVSAFQQLEEFRVGEGRVWSLGADARWITDFATFWGALDRYRHDRRGDATAIDWTQVRGSLGVALYLGSEPGRVR